PLRVEFFKADADGQEGQTFLGFDTFNATDFAAGPKTFTFTPAASVLAADKIVATATDLVPAISAGSIGVQGVPTQFLPGNTSEFSPTATITVGGVDLSVTKTDSPDPVAAGANLTYTITLTNGGGDDAFFVNLTDTIPTNTTF